MKNLKFLIGASLLLTAGLGNAALTCNDFEIKVKNNLAEDLLVTSIVLNGANLQPGGIQKIPAKTTQAFTVNDSAENVPMQGHFNLYTMSIPSKKVRIEYQLENKALACEHTDIKIDDNDYATEHTRVLGTGVNYTISNK